MRRVRGKNTGLELQYRKALWAAGLRYRLNSRLFGKPDLVFVRDKVVVFVDGCFWHGCPIHGEIPKSNEAFWAEKILKNILRDAAVTHELTEMGWTVCRVWEHEIKLDLGSCVRQLYETIKKKRNDGTEIQSK